MKPFVMSFFAALLLAGCSSSPPAGAEAFYKASLDMLDDVRTGLPAIQASAAEAAEFYCNDPSDPGLTIEGSEWLRSELDHRSGGIMAIVAWWPRETFHGIVLYSLRGGRHVDEDLKTIAYYTDQRNARVYLIGPADLIAQAQQGGANAKGTIVVPATTVEGVSTHDLATVAVSWTWMCEFVSACTRHGKMPVMFQSIKFEPDGMERIKKHTLDPFLPQRRYTKFHDDLTVKPIPAGKLGAEWLAMARKRLVTLHGREMNNIRQAAQWAVDAQTSGGTAYFWSTTHTLGRIGQSEHNPTNFAALPTMPKAGTSPFDHKTLSPNDVVLGIGYDAVVANDPEKLAWFRRSGCKVVLSAATYNPSANQTMPGELFITQPWEFGDADVTVPGYDVNIAPTSGLLAAEIYWMICAEINARTAATSDQ